MSEFKLTTVDEFEAATARLLETGAKVGADAWQLRVKNQTPHCKFGEQGICCRICSMGPCRITAKAPRGICGCDAHGIVGRNYLKFTAGGASAHSDHGREICHSLSGKAVSALCRFEKKQNNKIQPILVSARTLYPIGTATFATSGAQRVCQRY